MSVPGGGDITELLRQLGDTALIHEAESHGLAPKAGRMKCPWVGCEHKGAGRERSAQVFAAKHPRVFCYACNGSGDLVDLLERTRGLSRAEAIAHLKGQPVPERPRPALRVVGGAAADDAGKLQPSEVKRLWDALATTSELGRQYLERRGLEMAIDAGLIRFTANDSANKELAGLAKREYRIAALLSDVVGQPRGIQIRRAGDPPGKDPKVLSVKNSVTSRAFFGEPGLIEGAPVVAVAEGMADTLALHLWADGHVVVVGAAGKGFVPRLADELEAAGVDVTGKLFVLFPQNDRPQNKSRIEFKRLSQLLTGRGARVCWVTTPEECGDVADWRKTRPDVEWPPPELVKAYGNTPGDEAAPVSIVSPGLALPVPAQVSVERYAQDFTTLCALLDDPATREAIMGPGELSFSEMSWRVKWGAGRTITETDLSLVRLGLEGVARSTDNKPLKFAEGDIEKALTLLARRNQVHEARQWVESTPWDGVERLEVELPGILGHEAGGFEGRLLRRWFVSAVARASEPGCKVDTVLILTGAGGAKKSTFFEVLGGQWFTDSKVAVGDKDGLLVMREAWIVEWGELDSMRRARDVEATKAFLSARVDIFRKPYGHDVVSAPRHCVIVGTSNETEILTDPTGNRRFWPVEVLAKKIDVKWLRENRAQLFAEALALYRGGASCQACRDEGERCSAHRWWLTDEEEELLIERNKGFTSTDVWTDPIVDWLGDNRFLPYVTIAQVLTQAVRKDLEDLSEGDKRKVGGILRLLGWRSSRIYENREWKRVWLPPEVAAS